MRRMFRTTMVASLGTLVLAASACGSDDNPSADSSDGGGPVTISASNLPPKDNPESRQSVLDLVDEFEKANPNITVEVEETIWDPQTFSAMLAGGTLPTVMKIPFTEIDPVIDRGQAADLTDAIESNEALNSINPELMDKVKDDNDHIFGVPSAAYSIGLVYNRSLFEKADLDPDNPPQTWDDVQTAAGKIAAETGEPGLVMTTTGNTGGWILTAMDYAFGEQMMEEDGDSYRATVNTDSTKQALEFLRAVRWEDDAAGDNFLVDNEQIRNQFAAGKVGMFIGGGDTYTDIVNNRGLPADDYGLAPMPQDDDGLGTLGGGSIEIVNPKASPEEIDAALKWIEYRQVRLLTNEKDAVDRASSQAADKLPVGAPEFPIVDRDTYDQYLGWIDEHINVPREHFELYQESAETLPLISEPPAKAQELYAALDAVVQAVLTRENADIDKLLGDAEADIDALIAQG